MSTLDRKRAALGPKGRWTLAAMLVVLGSLASGLGACSFVVETQDRQCERDADCTGFDANAVCDVGLGTCVPRDAATSSSTGSGGEGGAGGGSSSSTGDPCVGDDGCFACAPSNQGELLNACTDAACIPYDNGQLEGLLNEDGSVPPVP